jgi:hypothetical protein
MQLPVKKIIYSKVYPCYEFEPYTPKMIQRGKWKRKRKCKNRQIRRVINRVLDKIERYE